MNYVRQQLGLMLLLIVAVPGCAKSPYAASAQRFQIQDEIHYKAVLDSSEQAAVRKCFRALGEGHHSVDLPKATVRWSDVPQAALFACDEIEAAIVQTSKADWGVTFEIRTVEDFPGELVIYRQPEPEVYMARATIGLYGDRTAKAAELLEAFDDQMRAFGRKRQIETPYE
jgi:hypothetical protein